MLLMQYYEIPNDLSSLVIFLKRMAHLFFEPLVFMRHFIKKNMERKRFSISEVQNFVCTSQME